MWFAEKKRKEKKRRKKITNLTKQNHEYELIKSGMIKQHQMNMKKNKINKNEKKRRNEINVETNSTNYLCAEKNLLWEICAREFI